MKDDSRKVCKGDTYIALTNNESFIKEAINNGAEKVIVESGLYNVDTLIVKNTRNYLINYLDELYHEKFKKIKIIGITGTNGKTTSCYLIWQALNKMGHKCAYIGTIGFYKDSKVKDLANTTPDILDIYTMINECIDDNYQYVVMEVSSQALSYDRIGKLEFDYGVFTNLTKDHMDYHKNMHNYALAKQKLFLNVRGKCVINYDDINKSYFLLDGNDNYTYGFDGGNYHITNAISTKDGSSFELNGIKYNSKLIGLYNIYNVSVMLIILDMENIKCEYVDKLECPPGRMDRISFNDNQIIVDYAHTPDAVENIISTIRKICSDKIITIIGCGGNRDRTKRPIMGKIASILSDYVIFTSDNPRYEDSSRIVNDMIQKLDKNNYEIELNREKAIIKGIQRLDKNDILLVLGKGHENYQIIDGERYPFDDKKVILENI